MSMRQADSAIRGYLYQFNKSIYEILQLADGAEITLEGVIEDIDIQSLSSTTTIQCKYHEDKKFKISDVAAPILEMFSHYCECNALGKSVSYILYAYYVDNPNSIDIDSILGFLSTTKDKDIQTKYFHRIYTIPDEGVLNLALKSQKSKDEKQTLFDYYTNNREKLVLKVPIRNFWNKFTYIPAEQFDVLQQAVIKEFSTIVDEDTAKNLYYPNAFSYVAHLSAKENVADRIVSKTTMLVCEEAHNYIPKSGGAEYAASKHSIERIAKEGRKYGLSLMVVSQRPSEVSDTIFSQCNNFVVLKLTNINDQNCIKNLLPDNNSSLVDVLPTLSAGECLIVGDAAPLPAVIKMDMPNPIPNSSNVNVYDEWNKNWIDIAFETVIKRWWKE